MKVAVFFLLAFGFVALPFAVVLVLTLLTPEPWLLAAEPPAGAQPAAEGATVTVETHATAREAGAAPKLAGIRASSQSGGGGTFRYTRADDGRAGVVRVLDRHVVRVEAADRAAVDAAFAALPFIRSNPKKGPMTAVFERPGLLVGALGLYCVVFLLWLPRGGAWAARVEPVGAPVGEAVLRERLLALNDLGLPFAIQEEGGRFVAEWRITDATWAGPIHAGGIDKVHRVHLDFDARGHRVRAIDEKRDVRWDGTVGTLSGRAAWFQGIVFAGYERGVAVGVLFDEDGGWSVRPAYDYRFALSELKGPLIDVVTRSGWTWAPVVTFFRPIGG